MYLNTKLLKAQYHSKHDRVVGRSQHQVKRKEETKERLQRTDIIAKVAGLFGIRLSREVKVLREWTDIITKEKRQGSKLGMKLFKSQMRSIARIQRKEQQGMKISMSELARTGMPIRLRDVRNAKAN